MTAAVADDGYHEQQIKWAVCFGRLNRRLYEGTVPGRIRNQRRAANRVARASRRVNRAGR